MITFGDRIRPAAGHHVVRRLRERGHGGTRGPQAVRQRCTRAIRWTPLALGVLYVFAAAMQARGTVSTGIGSAPIVLTLPAIGRNRLDGAVDRDGVRHHRVVVRLRHRFHDRAVADTVRDGPRRCGVRADRPRTPKYSAPRMSRCGRRCRSSSRCRSPTCSSPGRVAR